MSYDGHVSPGGPAATRELDALTIIKVSVGSMDNNAYLLECRASGELLLVDAAAEASRLLGLVGERRLGQVVTTHRHGDHWQALERVVNATGARTAAGRDDVEGIPVGTDDLLADGDTVTVGEVTLGVVQLVGHTPGSVALLHDDRSGHPHLFTGDSLFPGGVGRTTTPEDFASLLGDVESKLFGRLPDETWFYPGHGDDSTLRAERPHLEEWRARGW
ncbi:MAG TPA: MBL fold metallo-hydrolase [Actinomycetes bacterium]|nr:MBL fold metallo-hydrolase [Actinomycetes bacterium]